MATAEFATAEIGGSQSCNLGDHNQRCRIVIIGLSPESPEIICNRPSDILAQEGVQPHSPPLLLPRRSQPLLRL